MIRVAAWCGTVMWNNQSDGPRIRYFRPVTYDIVKCGDERPIGMAMLDNYSNLIR